MRVANVLQLEGKEKCLVVLLDEEGGRALPIGIGQSEALAIAIAAAGTQPPRPSTHDLIVSVVSQLGGHLERMVVHDLRGGTFIGQLDINTVHGVLEVDCRPSDGVAVAQRAGCPIMVDEEVLEKAGVDPGDLDDEEEADPPTWD